MGDDAGELLGQGEALLAQLQALSAEHPTVAPTVGLVVAGLVGVAGWRWGKGWLERRKTVEIESRLQRALAAGKLRQAGDIQAGRGFFREAARIYERGGDHDRSARALVQAGDLKGAAAAFEVANLPTEAAALYRRLGEHAKAAEAYAKSDDVKHQRSAAESLLQSGDALRAARLFERLGDPESAADAYAKCEKVDPRDYVAVMLQNAAMAAQDDATRRRLWRRTAEEAQRIGDHERAAFAYDRGGDGLRAANLYEQALSRYDVAAAIQRELGDEQAAARLTIAAGGELPVLRQLETRARERGEADAALAVATRIATLEPRPVTVMEQTAATMVAAGVRPGASSSAPPSASLSADRFEILGELGRGGMGIVYKARDKRLDRLVALKFLPQEAESDPTLVSVFRREARAAAALTHPSIVTVYDVGTLGEHEFIAMELVDGVTLDRVLETSGPPPLAEALSLIEATGEAIAFAHANGVIHRDLKPANIMRTATGIKVMDFGLAKVLGGAKLTGQKTVIAGTPAYAPPEQFTGATDHRSDVFALGATFYELLTGVLPGKDGAPASATEGYPSPRDRVPHVPTRLSELIMRCLERDPARRPPTAEAVVQELRAVRTSIRAADEELRRFLSDDEPAISAARPRAASSSPPASAPVTSAPRAVRAFRPLIPREDD